MPATRSLGFLFLLLIAAAAAVWFLSGGGAAPTVPGAATDATADRTGGTADAAGGTVDAPPAAAAAPATTRVEAAAAGSVDPAGFAVIGRVVDVGGRPVEGAEVREQGARFAFDPDLLEAIESDPAAAMANVRAASDDGRATVTGADGRFRLPVGKDGERVRLRIAARGHRILQKPVARPSAADVDAGDLELEQGAVVQGRVVDRAGNGIAAAKVSREAVREGAGEWFGSFDVDFDVPWAGGDQVETDAEGWFELPHAEPGEFRLRARHDDHPSARSDAMRVAAGAELRDVLLMLDPGAAIRGRVTGLPDGVEGVEVAVAQRRESPANGETSGMLGIFGGDDAGEAFADFPGFRERSAEVAADGTFVVRGLHIGRTYRVWATEKGGRFGAMAACTQRLEVATPVEGIELRYDPGIRVTFQVVDAETGAPIEQLWVGHALQGGGGMAELMGAAMARRGRSKEYADGRVTLDDLRPKDEQTLTLSIDALGHRGYERKDIALPRAGELDLGVVRLASAPALRVRVVGGADAAPVGKARVRVRKVEAAGRDVAVGFPVGDFGGGSGTESARTDDEGRCTVNAPIDESFVVVITHGDFARHESAPLRLQPGGNDYTATLSRGGSVVVTVVDADGKPVGGRSVQRRGADTDWDSENTDERGVATFTRLAPGDHRFRLSSRGGDGGMIVSVAFDVASGAAGTDQEGWQTVAVTEGGRAELQLVQPAGAELRGVVRENGAPLDDARITFLEGATDGPAGEIAGMVAGFAGGGRTTKAEGDGGYHLRDLPEGSHRLRITARSRSMPAVVPIVLRPGENVLDVDLDVAVVRGIVRGADGQPLEDAKVTVAPVRDAEVDEAMGLVRDVVPMELFGGGGRTAKTDAAGRFELRGVQAGAMLQVRATAKRHAPAQSAPFEVAVGGARDGVELQLSMAGRVNVTMTQKAPFVVAMARRLGADGEVEDGGRPVVQMLRGGKGTLDGLAAGRWRVTLQVPTGDREGPTSQDVDVVAGETVELSF